MFKFPERVSLAAVAVLAVFVTEMAQAGPETVTISAPAVSPLRGLNPSEGEAFVGIYLMSDGRQMVLRQRGRVIVADLDGVPLTRLLVGADRTLYAADDSMRLRLDSDPQDDVRAVTVSLRIDNGQTVTLASVKPAVR